MSSLHVNVPIVKRFSTENFLSRQNRSQNGGFSSPQRYILARNCVVWLFCVKISAGSSAVASLKNKKQNNSRIWGVIFHAYGKKKPWSDLAKFLHLGMGRYPGHNHLHKIWERLVKGFSLAIGQILGFFIGFRRRPYITVALYTMRVCD